MDIEKLQIHQRFLVTSNGVSSPTTAFLRNRGSLLKSAKMHIPVLGEGSIPCSLLTVPNDDPGILSWLGDVGLKRTWDQELSSGLVMLSASSKMFLSVRQDVQPGFGWLSELGRK